MSKEYEELTGFDLAKAVWEALGWDVKRFESRAGWKMRRRGESHWCAFLRADLCLDHCLQAELEIVRRGLGSDYLGCLGHLLQLPQEWESGGEEYEAHLLKFVLADAETRCRAILKAVWDA